jgi:hypothetical protein
MVIISLNSVNQLIFVMVKCGVLFKALEGDKWKKTVDAKA